MEDKKKEKKPVGRPEKYNEPTEKITFRCPKSKIEHFRKYAYQQLQKWQKT
jgi:hypothetical protein